MTPTPATLGETSKLVGLIILLVGGIIAHAFRPETWSNRIVSYVINVSWALNL